MEYIHDEMEEVEEQQRLVRLPIDKATLYQACPVCPNFHFIHTTPLDNAKLMAFTHASYPSFKRVVNALGCVDFKYIANRKVNSYQNQCQLKWKSKNAPPPKIRAVRRFFCRSSRPLYSVHYNYIDSYYSEYDEYESDLDGLNEKPQVYLSKRNVHSLLTKQMRHTANHMSRKAFDRLNNKKKFSQFAKQCGCTTKGNSLVNVSRRKGQKQMDRARRSDRDSKCDW